MPHTLFALVLLIGSLTMGMPWTGSKARSGWDPNGAPGPQAGNKAGGKWDPNGAPEPQA